jgi:hypothetical protein
VLSGVESVNTEEAEEPTEGLMLMASVATCIYGLTSKGFMLKEKPSRQSVIMRVAPTASAGWQSLIVSR